MYIFFKYQICTNHIHKVGAQYKLPSNVFNVSQLELDTRYNLGHELITHIVFGYTYWK